MAKRAKRVRTRHIRRADPMPHADRWRLKCDCGWSTEVEAVEAGRVLTGSEIQAQLNRQFVAHLKPGERRLYVLVDQRQRTVAESEAEDAEMVEVAAGNFLMPEGTPVLLTSWHESEGVYFGHWLDPKGGDSGVLPVGEIRTADGRVMRIDAPA